MRKWISFPKQEGTSSRQAHPDFPEQAIYEREAGRSGFFGPATHFHHQHAPTGWSEWEGPLKPRAFDFNQLTEQAPENPWLTPDLLSNSSCKFRIWHCSENMPYLVRNADGDDLLFVHEGSGHLYCDYGHIHLVKGDYFLVPRSTNWRLEPSAVSYSAVPSRCSTYCRRGAVW